MSVEGSQGSPDRTGRHDRADHRRAVKASHRRAKRSVILGSSSDDGAVEPLTLREARRLALARAGLLKPEWTGLPVVDKGYETNRRDKCQLDIIGTVEQPEHIYTHVDPGVRSWAFAHARQSARIHR